MSCASVTRWRTWPLRAMRTRMSVIMLDFWGFTSAMRDTGKLHTYTARAHLRREFASTFGASALLAGQVHQSGPRHLHRASRVLLVYHLMGLLAHTHHSGRFLSAAQGALRE